MPENPNFVGDSGEAGRHDPVEVGSIHLNFKCLDDESPGSQDSYRDFHHQNLKSDSAASLLSILSLTSSRLSKSFSSLSKKSPSSPPCEKTSKEEEAKQLHKKKEWATRSFGLFLAFVSGVLMTAYSSMIKMLDTMDSMQVVVIRGLLQLVVMGSVARYKKMPFRGTDSRRIAALLLLVAVTGGLRILFIFTSFSRLPLGDSTTILFSSPVIVMVLSMFILKERCGVFRVVAAAGLLSGVILISKPPFIFGQDMETYDALGYSLVMCACGMSALGIVLTKLISKSVEKLLILFYLGLATATTGTVGLLVFGQPSLAPATDWVLAIVIGLLGMVQQYVLVWAVQLESPARVTVVRQFQIVLAYGVQITLFGVMPTVTDMVGAGLVLVTVISIPFEKFLNSKLCPAREEETEVVEVIAGSDIKEKKDKV